MKPYSTNKKTFRDILKNGKYKKRIEVAITQANDAEKLPLYSRLAKYSFIARYPGSINKPKNISKHDVMKYQNKIKRKYNIGNTYPDESADESHDVYETEKNGHHSFSVKENDMITLGTTNRQKGKKSRIDKTFKPTDNMKETQVSNAGEDSSQISHEEDNGNLIQLTMNGSAKQTDSMAVEVDSMITSLMTVGSSDHGNIN